MPIVFGFVGILLIVAGVRGTVAGTDPSLVSLVKADFTGQPNYLEWVIAILLIGAVGYIPKLEPISRGFMVLVVVGLFLSNKGFFDQLKGLTSSSALTSPLVSPSSVAAVPTVPTIQSNTK